MFLGGKRQKSGDDSIGALFTGQLTHLHGLEAPDAVVPDVVGLSRDFFTCGNGDVRRGREVPRAALARVDYWKEKKKRAQLTGHSRFRDKGRRMRPQQTVAASPVASTGAWRERERSSTGEKTYRVFTNESLFCPSPQPSPGLVTLSHPVVLLLMSVCALRSQHTNK